MAKHSDTPDMIEEIEGAAEKLAQWIADNALLVGAMLVLVLGGAAAFGGYRSWARGQEEAASDALARTRNEYLLALGAEPGAIEEPELANPAAAKAIREQNVEKFRAVAREHAGTVAGTLALVDVAELLEKLGRPGESETVWKEALARIGSNPGLEGLLHQRVAALAEARGDLAEAAAHYETAGRIAEFPLRYWALVEAARSYALAGEPDRALALYEEVEREAPHLELPAHLRTQLRELRATRGRS